MTRPTIPAARLVALLALAAALAGCLPCRTSCPRGCPLEPTPPLPPQVQRSNLADKILAQPAPAMQATFASIRGDSLPYHAYSPLDVQCEAAARAPVADGLDKERARIGQQAQQGCRGGTERVSRQRAMQQMILFYTAQEIRNDSAGLALEWYFQLAGYEAETDLTEAGQEEVKKALAEVADLQRRGLRVPVEIEKVRRQLLEAEQQHTSALLNVETTNERLHQLMAHGCNPAWRMWPEPLPPGGSVPIPDIDSAVAVGLAERPYLQLLRCLLQDLDTDTLPVVQQMMRSVSPMLAMQEPSRRCKHLAELVALFTARAAAEASLETIHSQLCSLLHRQEGRVASEIRQAIAGMRGHQELTLLLQQRVERYNVELQKMEEKVSHGLLSSLELVNPRLERLKAEGEVCKEWLSVLGAAAKLRQAQGLLIKECLGACGTPAACPPRSVPHLPTEMDGDDPGLPASLPGS
jgi:hypothetical protein